MESNQLLAESNALQIEEEIRRLKTTHTENGKIDFPGFWAHSKQIADLFRNLKPILSEDRERLWTQFHQHCDEVKLAQKHEKEALTDFSARKRKLILDKIESAMVQIEGVRSTFGITNAQAMLTEAMKWMKGDLSAIREGTPQYKVLSSKLIFEDQNLCWAHWKDAQDLLQASRVELSDQNHHDFFERAIKSLKAAREDDPFSAKEMVREIQNDLKTTLMNQGQFQEVRDVLDQAWKLAILRQEEKKKESAIKSLDNLERWETTILKNNELIERLQAQVEECRIMEKDATSYEFAMKVKGWIEEKLEKIHSINQTNIELEQKIVSARIKASESGIPVERNEKAPDSGLSDPE